MFTDSHCHLSFPELSQQIAPIRLAMEQAQVTRALCICTTLEEFASVHALATQYDNFWATVGVHPDNEDVREPTEQDLVTLGSLPRVVAIGETGLDYYRLGTQRRGHGLAARALSPTHSSRPATGKAYGDSHAQCIRRHPCAT